MKKFFMLLALSGLISNSSLFAEDDDFNIGYPDDDESSYQTDNEEGSKLNDESPEKEENKTTDDDYENVGYIDENPGE